MSGACSRCRIRVYLPEQKCDAPVVLCSELADNPGIAVTGAAENIAAAVLLTYRLVDPVWIEYHPEETTVAGEESFELVVFSDYNIRKAVSLAGARVEVGQPLWKPLDRHCVEVLIEQPLE